MQKVFTVSVFILALMAILSGGLLLIPSTATLNPTVEKPSSIIYRPVVKINAGSLQEFVTSVENGQKNTVVGIYVPGLLALPVSQQPSGQAGYVTRNPNELTQFNLASQYGTVGILAHNDLAGADFTNIEVDDYAVVVYGDGHIDYYQVSKIEDYQALTPSSTFSDFIDLDNNRQMTAGNVFNRIYGPGNRLVLQTCITANGDPSWGRMFIIATPANLQVKTVINETTRLFQFASFGLLGY